MNFRQNYQPEPDSYKGDFIFVGLALVLLLAVYAITARWDEIGAERDRVQDVAASQQKLIQDARMEGYRAGAQAGAKSCQAAPAHRQPVTLIATSR